MDCLILNSYCGSLVLGAKAAGLPIRGSYEDVGFGINIQKLNFPELRFIDRTPWPKDDLSNTIVIAHPPCASFSNMNLVKDRRGVATDGFECHRRVMDYALGQQCNSLAIESVPGALEAAGSEYAAYAQKYGYDHVFLLLNAISLGVPQWRPRFWAIFYRDKKPIYEFCLTPTYRNVQSILDGEAATDPVTRKHVEYLSKKYRAAGFNFEEMMRSDTQGGFDKLAKAYLGEKDMEELKRRTGTLGLFRAGLPRKLDPTLWSSVILGFSLFYVHDRPLNHGEYCALMGFPKDWKWPQKEFKDFLTYLSKGVCPPVAEWVLRNLTMMIGPVTHTVLPGCTLDLQPQKKDVEEILRGTRDSNAFVSHHVDWPATNLPSKKPKMTLAEFQERYMRPAVAQVVHEPNEMVGPWQNWRK